MLAKPMWKLVDEYTVGQLLLNFRSLSAFETTDTELKAIAPPAIAGLKKPNAANGIPTVL